MAGDKQEPGPSKNQFAHTAPPPEGSLNPSFALSPGPIEEKEIAKEMGKAERVMARWAMVTAFGTIVSAGAICFQWWEMHTGGKDTTRIADAAEKQRDSADKIRQASERNANAAEGFAASAGLINTGVVEATKKLGVQATSGLTASRAWIVVKDSKFGYLKDDAQIDRVSSNVVLTNSGPSPAMNVRGWRCAYILNAEPIFSSQMSKYPGCVSESLGMIGKDAPIIMHANDTVQVVAPNSLEAEMHTRGSHFYAWGYYTYDIIPKGKRHYFKFCLLNADDSLGACAHGNDGD